MPVRGLVTKSGERRRPEKMVVAFKTGRNMHHRLNPSAE
jgi:hypothetical protein